MNISRFWKHTAAMLLSCLILAGCGAGNAEHWAYIHEPEKEVLTLGENGKAEYKGKKYSYTKDDTTITLRDDTGAEEAHRYVVDGEQMIFYERSVYTRDTRGQGEGLTGTWMCGNNLYTFSPEGEFSEENIFFGRYAVDEAAGTIKLMYSDPIEDSLLYYHLEGDQLTIDYPWPMVHAR